MLDKKYREYDYYWKKFPLYLRNSYGMDEWVNIFWTLLLTIDDNVDAVLDMLDIYAENYMAADIIDGYDMAMLDHLAAYAGVSREMTFNYDESSGSGVSHVTAHAKFTNRELLMVIKCRLLHYAYHGTFEEIVSLYRKLGLTAIYIPTGESASAYIYMSPAQLAKLSPSGNLAHAFKAGLLTVQSMGIRYEYRLSDLNESAWDTSKWDEGGWL